MNKTFADMKANVGLELQDTSTAFGTLIGKFLNRRYFAVLRSINFNAINEAYSFTSVLGTTDYALPRDFSKAVYVKSSSDTSNPYTEVKFDEQASNPNANQTYTIFDSPVMVQPTAAGAVTIVSSSASDTSASVSIRGIVSGAEVIETLTLVGTTPVTSSNSFTRILAITKSLTIGTITITCNSQTIAIMDAELKVNKLKVMRIFVPEGATILCPYHIMPLPMSNDNDVPVIDIDDCLEAGARSDGWRYKRQGTKATVEEQIFQMLLVDYQWTLESNPNMSNMFKPVPYPRD